MNEIRKLEGLRVCWLILDGRKIEIDYYDKKGYILAFASTYEEDGDKDRTTMGKSKSRKRAIHSAVTTLIKEIERDD
ncbi:hypothetical protein [Rossellomorea aquimaris]|uniref:hypothetical protein n=1 Tax=Rossellomorea aquimaris TaxID=189382 RepID=UPI0012E85254|nr:hypothetical protein [Rossellomorea aquimaris]